jgi:hypothetical protein
MNYFYRPNFYKSIIRSVCKNGVKKLSINKKQTQTRNFSQLAEDPKTDPPPRWLIIAFSVFTFIQVLHIW